MLIDNKNLDSSNFFAWCAVTDTDLLKSSRDRMRTTAMGVMMCLIACLATVSAFALLTVSFKLPVFSAASGALFYGAIIFSLYRLMVASLHRGDWKMAIPRLILALVIAFLIGDTLLMTVFQGEIKAKIAEWNTAHVNQTGNSINQELNPRIAVLQIENQSLQSDIKAADQNCQNAINAEITEIEGQSATKQRGKGVAWAEKLQNRTRLCNKNADLTVANEKKIAENEKSIAALEKQISDAKAADNNIQEAAAGMLQQHKAMYAIIFSNISAFVLYLLFTILSVSLETTPLLTKVFARETTYSQLTKSQDDEFMLKIQADYDVVERKSQIERDISLEGEQARLDTGKRIALAASSGNFENLSEAEKSLAVDWQNLMLDDLRRQIFRRENKGRGANQFGQKIVVDVPGSELEIRLQLPAANMEEISLADLQGDLREITKEVGDSEPFFCPVKLTGAVNSDQRKVRENYPLLAQLLPDNRLILRFERAGGISI